MCKRVIICVIMFVLGILLDILYYKIDIWTDIWTIRFLIRITANVFWLAGSVMLVTHFHNKKKGKTEDSSSP